MSKLKHVTRETKTKLAGDLNSSLCNENVIMLLVGGTVNSDGST